MANSARKTLPVVRWLQLGTVAAGIGVALLAAPGVAAADTGGGPSSSHSSASSGSPARDSGDRHAAKAKTGRATPRTAPRTPARTTQPAGVAAPTRSTTSRIAAPASTLAAVTAPKPVATGQRVAVPQSIQQISDALQQFLATAANALSDEPSTPVNRLLQDGVYLLRRTLFPASVGVITRPIKVPLYFQSIDNAGTQKLGIYVSLGYGAPPQLFEFDTGAGGFYAAYASDDPLISPWWGQGVTTSSTKVEDKFDSGLEYKGYAATSTVSLYTVGSSTPLVTSGAVTVGQMDRIKDGTTGQELWTPHGVPHPTSPPPIDNAFYGDFGMAPTYQANGIDQVIAQLTFGRGVKPGYVVHVDPVTGEAWMQIGLTSNNIHNAQGMYFPMLPDPKATDGQSFPNSHLKFYGLQLFDATINIIDQDGTLLINTPNVGITPDTGANTTLHNTNLSPQKDEYKTIIDWEKDSDHTKGKLETDMLFFLTGTTTGQTPVRYFQFVTTHKLNAGDVKVQDPSGDAVGANDDLYYLNTGISLFFNYDVVYSLGTTAGNGTLGLLPKKS